MKNELKDFDKVERRNHGCDGCRKDGPTERFDGWIGHYLWLCGKCYKELVTLGIRNIDKESQK